MHHQATRLQRVLVRVAAVAAGATGVVIGAALPAGAHESKVEPEPVPNGSSCPDQAERLDIDQTWVESKVEDVADGDANLVHTLDDRGTADEADDATVTIKLNRGKTFEWEANVGIDAVFVQGRDDRYGGYFYLYARDADDEEVSEDIDLGTPPWHAWDKNKIKSISFCWDDEHHPPTSSTTSTSSTSTSTTSSTTSSTSTTSTTTPSSTSTSVAPTTAPPTTAPPTRPGPGLPQTGSNTGPLVAAGLGLLAAGGALVGGTWYWRRRFA